MKKKQAKKSPLVSKNTTIYLSETEKNKSYMCIEHISNREEQIIETQDEPQWIEA